MSGFVLDAPVSAFHGMDLAKAQILDGALYGYPVRVASTKDYMFDVTEGMKYRSQTYIFRGLANPRRDPTKWTRDPFSTAWDMRLEKSTGIYRILSPSICVGFKVVGDRLLQCETCLQFRPPWELRDFGLGFNEDFGEQERLVSMLCCRRGDCE